MGAILAGVVPVSGVVKKSGVVQKSGVVPVSGVVLASGVLPVAGNALVVPSALRFDVLRNGLVLGHHTVAFHAEADTLVATVAVEIVYRLGPVVLYRYAHSVREIWRGDRFLSLDSDTNDDGTRFHVHAVDTADRVVIETLAGPRNELPGGTIPLTHWNILCMRRKLFNPQDGAAFDYSVVNRGEEALLAPTVHATHYSLIGAKPLEDWYDAANRWVGLRATGTDGSRIDYRLAAGA